MIGTSYNDIESNNPIDIINYTHSATVTAHKPIYVAGLGVLIPLVSTSAATTEFAAARRGRFNFCVTNSVAITVGLPVYYNTATDKIQLAVPAAGFFLGTAVEAATGNSGGTVYCAILINEEPGSVQQDQFERLSPATITSTGAETMTAAQLVGGLVLADPGGADRTYTLPTAALLVASISGIVADGAIECVIKNTADADEKITLAAGSGGTLSPTSIIIRQNQALRLKIRITNATSTSEAYTVYAIEINGASDIVTSGKINSLASQIVGKFSAYDMADTAPTLTAAQVLGGVIYGTIVSARTATFCAAADIWALIPGAAVGSSIVVTFVNNGADTDAITVAVPASITNKGLAGHLTVAQNTARSYRLIFTSSTAADLFPMN